MPDNTVKVDRSTKWGNPYKLGDNATMLNREETIKTNEQAVKAFKKYLLYNPEFRKKIKEELAGKNLACWCGLNQACHADVLLSIANS